MLTAGTAVIAFIVHFPPTSAGFYTREKRFIGALSRVGTYPKKDGIPGPETPLSVITYGGAEVEFGLASTTREFW